MLRPSVCLSVCLPSLVFSSDSQSPFRPQTVRRPSVIVSTTRCLSIRRLLVCLSVHLPTRSCLSTNCPSSFRPPAASLSVSLSSHVFSHRPLTVRHRFNRRLPICLSVCLSACPLLFFRRLSITVSTAGCVSIHQLFVTIFDADCPPGQGVADAGRGRQ